MTTTLREHHPGAPGLNGLAWFAVAVLGWLGLVLGVALLVHGRAWLWMRLREMGRSLMARVRAEHVLLSLALAARREPRAAKAAITGAARRPVP